MTLTLTLITIHMKKNKIKKNSNSISKKIITISFKMYQIMVKRSLSTIAKIGMIMSCQNNIRLRE